MRLQTASRTLLSLSLVWSQPVLLRFCLARDYGAARGHEISAPAATVESCESRTINYITHTLPQQCLRTSWSDSSNNASSVTAVEEIHVPTSAQSGSEPAASTPPAAAHRGSGGGPTEGDDEAASRAGESGGAGDSHDQDSDLATSSFMSFEEWKEVQLKKAGQDPNDMRSRRQQGQHHERGDRGEDPAQQDLDSVGDDGEINLDFDALSEKVSEITAAAGASSGSGGEGGASSGDGGAAKAAKEDVVLYGDGTTQYIRSKDAGKTCKERFSYASFDAGATILKTSLRAKNAKAILVENKDSYMLLECSQPNKFVVVELSDDILVDTVVLANFEFFSSMVRAFRVSVSDRYPVKAEKLWKDLGTFEARNQRDIQAFLVEHPQIWAKYIRIEFLTHYGNEFYCPISLLRVHGTRMIDSWKEVENGGRDDDDEPLVDPPPPAVEENSHATATSIEAPESSAPPGDGVEPTSSADIVAPPTVTEVGLSPWRPIFREFSSLEVCEMPGPTAASTDISSHSITPQAEDASTAASTADGTGSPSNGSASDAEAASLVTPGTTPSSSAPTSSRAEASTTKAEDMSVPANASLSDPAASSYVGPSPSPPDAASSPSPPPEASQASPQAGGSNGPRSPPSSSHSSPKPKSPTSVSKPMSKNPKSPPHRQQPSTTVHSSAAQHAAAGSGPGGGPGSKHNSNDKPSGSSSHHSSSTGSGSAAAASPTVQESFFKTVAKRLQLLESNTSLSLQYIEDQSRFLQEALTKMERKQISRVDSFLDGLNRTVLAELRSVRQQYDQIWQSTVIALESQRDQSQREIVALSARLNVLADEVVFQKRMAILQSVLLLACLVLIVFSHSLSGAGGGGGSSSFYLPSSTSRYFAGAASPPPPSGRFFEQLSGSPSMSPSPTAKGALPRHEQQSLLAQQRQQQQQSPPQMLLRTRSAPAAQVDKTLPLTPTSECDSGHFNPTPSIHVVDEPARPEGPPSPGYFDRAHALAGPGLALAPSPLGSSPEVIPHDASAQPVDRASGESIAYPNPPLMQTMPPLDGSPVLLSVEEARNIVSGIDGGIDGDLVGFRANGGGGVGTGAFQAQDAVAQESRPPLTRTLLSNLDESRKPLPALPEDPVQFDEVEP